MIEDALFRNPLPAGNIELGSQPPCLPTPDDLLLQPEEKTSQSGIHIAPALSAEQEEQYRELGREGPLVVGADPAVTTAAQPTRKNSLHLTRTATHQTLQRVSTKGTTSFAANAGEKPVTVTELAGIHTREGFKIVGFTPGAGEDPREWSKGKKWFVTVATSLLCLSVALGSSIITGDMTGPTKEFGTTQEIVNLTVTCFVIGFGIGPMFLAPLSEIFGRSLIYRVSMFLFFIFTLPSALSKNIATLVVARQIAGIAASAPVTNVGGSKDRGAPMALFSGTLFIGPCLGPMIGGWIGQRAGWRWIYWVLFIIVGACWIFTFFIPESLAPTLEELERLPFKETLKNALYRPIVMLFTEPIVIFMSIYLSFIYSLLYLMFFAFPIAFAEIRGWGDGLTGIAFVSIMRKYAEATKHGSFPEARLYPMMYGAFVMPAALFMFAFTGAYPWVHWIGVCIASYIFGFSMILIYVSANSYIIDSYSNFAATAMAAKTLMRSEIGAMVPLFVNQMYGEKIRAKSARASQLKRFVPGVAGEKA
ncbi:spermine transporter [Ephemerocybe angulata]|uniref:Spermine transporter n=1 Tax=Ephemerocybe angulata TaxID=980116 RepID=A0A8H6HBL2_9AGAR|nr:spermine transporter [Tulosesus angulatus]